MEGEPSRRHVAHTRQAQTQPNIGIAPSHFPPSSTSPADSQIYATRANTRNTPQPFLRQTSTQLQPPPTLFSLPTPMSPSFSGPSTRLTAITASAPQLPPCSQHPNFSRGPGPWPAQGQNGYPREKSAPDQPREFPLPIAVAIEIATAPRAVDLGLGPASPRAEYLQGNGGGALQSLQSSPPSIPMHGSTGGYLQLLSMAPKRALLNPPTAPSMFLSTTDMEYMESNVHAAYPTFESVDTSGYSYRR